MRVLGSRAVVILKVNSIASSTGNEMGSVVPVRLASSARVSGSQACDGCFAGRGFADGCGSKWEVRFLTSGGICSCSGRSFISAGSG